MARPHQVVDIIVAHAADVGALQERQQKRALPSKEEAANSDWDWLAGCLAEWLANRLNLTLTGGRSKQTRGARPPFPPAAPACRMRLPC